MYSFLLFYFTLSISLYASEIGIVNYFKNIFNSTATISLRITTIISFFAYSLSAYFFLWFFSKKSNIKLGLIIVLLFSPIVISFRYILEEMMLPFLFGFRNYNAETSFSFYLKDNIYFAIPYTAFGIVFYLIQSNYYNEIEKRELLNQNRLAELNFLKYQINPHFLFNNLNNIYSLIYHKSDNALIATERLSLLLRYMLYSKNEKVLLNEELEYLLSFIELQKLRFDFELPVNINIANTNNKLQIAPLLLIPIVENAFKHGDFKQKDDQLIIDICTKVNELNAIVANKKSNYKKDETQGIGIVNLKRRLELIYPTNFELEITESETHYKTSLKINL